MQKKSNKATDPSRHSKVQPSQSATASEYLPVTREELEREVAKEKGVDYLKANKARLDMEWDYIDSL